MKKLLLSVVVATTLISGANAGAPVKAINFTGGGDGSNSKGLIQIGLGYGFTLGGANVTITPKVGEALSEKGVGITGNTNLRAQYGLADAISAGIYVRKQSGAYVTTSDDLYSSSTTVVASGMGFGLEAKYHVVNKEKFDLYFAPSIGFATAKFTTEEDPTFSQKGSGLNYGITGGFNWYWAKFIGMSFDMGYSGGSLKGDYIEDGENLGTIKVKNGGFYMGFGLVTKFGGE